MAICMARKKPSCTLSMISPHSCPRLASAPQIGWVRKLKTGCQMK